MIHPLNITAADWTIIKSGVLNTRVSVRRFRMSSKPSYWHNQANKIVRLISQNSNWYNANEKTLVVLEEEVLTGTVKIRMEVPYSELEPL